uniref:Uncharacterized protein n=1 Tax=Caenorhabditis japonica TaxID=281687 RepID=A0A8R1DGA7_CAEJA
MAFWVLFPFLLALSTASPIDIDCSRQDSCFGEPKDCDPEANCDTLFQFEEDGSLNLYLRNFNNPFGYAAFAIARHPDETIEYFVCLPNERQRLRAIAELGGIILVTEQNFTNVVEKLANNYFRCFFNISELPTNFQRDQVFFISKGTFDEALVILDGVQLHNLELDDEDDDDDFDDDSILPTIHYIGAPMPRAAVEDVFSEADAETLSDAISRMQKVSRSKDDDKELEKLVEKKTRHRAEKREENSIPDSYEDEEEDRKPRRYSKNRSSSLSRLKHPSRSEETQDEDEEQDEDDLEKDQRPRRRDSSARRRSSSRNKDESEEEPPRRNNRLQKRRPSRHGDDEEDEDEEEEDEKRYPRKRDHRRHRNRNRNHNSNRKTEEEEEEDADEEEDVYDDKPSKTNRRRQNKNNKRKNHDDEEYDEDSESDSSNIRLDFNTVLFCVVHYWFL